MTYRKLNSRWETEVIIIQGQSRQRLIDAVRQRLQFLSARPKIAVKDLAYSLNCPLKASNCRLAVVAGSLNDLEKKLTYARRRLEDSDCKKIRDRSGIYFFERPLAREGSVAFLFPGEGSQYFNMLSDLCLYFPEVRIHFDRADRIFLEEGWDILPSYLLFQPENNKELSNDEHKKKLWEINLAVASVFTGDYALWSLMDRLEIRPQAVTGHSSGEFAALIAAGAVKIEDNEELVQLGRDLIHLYTALKKPDFKARLMTVGVSDPAIVASAIEAKNEDLYIAMDNCPHQVILCGRELAIERAYNRLNKKGAICSFLPYDRPYHTPLYRQVSDQFLQFFKNRSIASPHTALYSCATTRPYPAKPAEVRQLAVDQWSQMVRFRETIEAMYAQGVRIFIEVGPRGNLTSFVDDILTKRRYLAVPANLHNRSGITQVNHMIGLLAAHGVSMRLDYLYEGRSANRVSMDKAEPSGQLAQKPGAVVRLTHKTPKIRLNSDSQYIKSLETHLFSKSSLTAAGSDKSAPGHNKAMGEKTQHQNEFHDYSKQFLSEAREGVSRLRPAESSHSANLSKSEVMQEYFNTMDNFLNVQQKIMKTFVEKKRLAKSAKKGRIKK